MICTGGYARGDVLALAEQFNYPGLDVPIPWDRRTLTFRPGRYAWGSIPRFDASINRLIVDALRATSTAAKETTK